jgi:hypothetical protein
MFDQIDLAAAGGRSANSSSRSATTRSTAMVSSMVFGQHSASVARTRVW